MELCSLNRTVNKISVSISSKYKGFNQNLPLERDGRFHRLNISQAHPETGRCVGQTGRSPEARGYESMLAQYNS
jgi:hypothetical protein